jgi:hypothetical protein
MDIDKAVKFERILEMLIRVVKSPASVFGDLSIKDAEALLVSLERARGCASNLVDTLGKEYRNDTGAGGIRREN